MTKYAKLRRNIIRAGLFAALVFNIQVARAAYTQLTPPVGWSAGAAGTAGAGGEFAMLLNKPVTTLAPPTISAGRISALASLSVNGKSVAVPAVMRLAPTAAKVAGALIFANPYVRTAATIATWLTGAAIIWDFAENKWKVRDDSINTGPYEYRVTNMGIDTGWLGDFETACDRFASALSGRPGYQGASITRYLPNDLVCHYQYTYDNSPYNDGFYVSRRNNPNAGTEVKWRPIEQDEFIDRIGQKPMPDQLPTDLPYPLPVRLPEIQPLFIPTGNPVPNPNYDPSAATGPNNQPYNQPGVRVVPAPTASDPWRVDLQPTDRPTTSPDPTGPVTDDGGEPGDKPSDDKPGLCDMYPDILACAKPDLDTPDGEIPKAQRSVELSDSDLFGGGSCPANVYATVGHQYLQVWNWDQSCYYIVKYLKPVILVLGAFTALMIVSGGTKE